MGITSIFHMKSLKLFLLFATLFIAQSSFSQGCISVNEAKNYLGQEAQVCGKVIQLSTPNYIKGNPTFLNLGGEYPNHSFSVVVWGDDKKSLNIDLNSLEGKIVKFKGLVRENNGKPSIIVSSAEQIKVEE